MASNPRAHAPFDFNQPSEQERAAKLIARQTAIREMSHTRVPFTRDDHVLMAKASADGLLADHFKQHKASRDVVRAARSAFLSRVEHAVDELRKPNPAFTPRQNEFTPADWERVNARVHDANAHIPKTSPFYQGALMRELERALAEKYGLPEPERTAQLAHTLETERVRSARASDPTVHDAKWLEALDAYRNHVLDTAGFHHAFRYLSFREQVLRNVAHRDQS